MNAVYTTDEPTLKSAVQTLIDQHGLARVLGTLLTRAVRKAGQGGQAPKRSGIRPV